MNIRAIAVAAAGFLALTAQAWAGISGPTGWKSEMDSGALVFTSPGQAGEQRVLYTMLPVELSAQAMEFWFDERVPALLKGLGKIGAQGQARGMGDYVMQIAAVTTPNGVDARVVLMGYNTLQGHQMLLILIPSQVPDDDARVKAAFAHGQNLVQNGLANDGSAPVPAAPKKP